MQPRRARELAQLFRTRAGQKQMWRWAALVVLLVCAVWQSSALKPAAARFDQIKVTPDKLLVGTLGVNYVEKLTASGGGTSYYFSIEDRACEGRGLPRGLSLENGVPDEVGTLIGTPQEAGIFRFTVKVTSSPPSNIPALKHYTLVIRSVLGNEQNCPGLGLVAETPIQRVVFKGQAFSQSFSVEGGQPPYTLHQEHRLSERLPDGLTLNLAGTKATLKGTPTETGRFAFTLRVQDAQGCFGVLPLCELEVRDAGCAATNAVSLFPQSLEQAIGTRGEPYPLVFRASGGTAPYTFRLDDRPGERLPTGLKLAQGGSNDQALLQDKPTEAGTFNFTLRVVDSSGCATTRTYTLLIREPEPCRALVVLSPENLSNGTIELGETFSQVFTATGGEAPYTFTVTGLPPEWLLPGDRSDQVKLSGRPSKPGSFAFTVSAEDKNRCRGSQTYLLNVHAAGCQVVTLAPLTLPEGIVEAEYQQLITARQASGAANYSFSVTGGLPPGLALSATGMLTGKPAQAGTFEFTVMATTEDGRCVGCHIYKLVVRACPQLSVAPATLRDGVRGVAYPAVTFTAQGGSGSYTFKAEGKLPAGMTLSESGVLSGTPTVAGAFQFTITATDAGACGGVRPLGSRTVVLLIKCPGVAGALQPLLLPHGTVDVAYSLTLTASGGLASYSFELHGALPSGLSFDQGRLFGTPKQAGSFPLQGVAFDAERCPLEQRDYTLVIECPEITVSLDPPTIPLGRVGMSYAPVQFTATGGQAPYTFELGGTLPAGLSFSKPDARLAGTPTQAGVFPITITARAADLCRGAASHPAGSRAYLLVVKCPDTVLPAPLPSHDAPVCEGGTLQLRLAATMGARYFWVGPRGFSSTEPEPRIERVTHRAAGDYLVAYTLNNCPAPAGRTTVAIQPTPVAAAGPDQTQCQTTNGTTVFDPVGVAANGPATWSVLSRTGTANATIVSPHSVPTAVNVTGTGTVTLRLTVPSICQNVPAAVDDVVLTVNPAPLANAGPDQTHCQAINGTTLFNLSGTAGNSDLAWSVLSQTGTANATIASPKSASTAVNVTGLGTVTLRLTVPSNCRNVPDARDDVVLTVTPAPVAKAGEDQEKCQAASGTTDFRLNGMAANGTFKWSVARTTGTASATFDREDIPNPTVRVAGVGAVTVRLTVSCRDVLPAVDDVVLTVQPAPTANAGPDQAQCQAANGQTIFSLDGMAANGTPIWSQVNSTGTASATFDRPDILNPMITVAGVGTVTLRLTVTGAAVCPSATDELVLRVEPAPMAAAGPDQTKRLAASGPTVFPLNGLAANGRPTWSVLGTTCTASATIVYANNQAQAVSVTGVGTVTLRLTTTNDNCVAQDEVVFTANPALLPDTIPTRPINQPFSQSFSQTGGPAPATFSLTGRLPCGVEFSAATATLAGTPRQAGAFPFKLTAQFQNGCPAPVSRDYLLVIDECAPEKISVNPFTLSVACLDTPFTPVAFMPSGATGAYTLKRAGALPAGMSLVNGVLSGVPKEIGVFPFTVAAEYAERCGNSTNNCASHPAGQRDYVLVVGCGCNDQIAITQPEALPPGTACERYATPPPFVASGSAGPYSFEVYGLPEGLSYSSGQLTGTPTVAGDFVVTVVAADERGCMVGSRTYPLTINCPSVALTPATLPDATLCLDYKQTVATSRFSANSFKVTAGALPAGLSLNSATGAITGRPAASATEPARFTITATGFCSTCRISQEYTLKVNCPAITLSPALPRRAAGKIELPSSRVNAFYDQTLTATPAECTYAFALVEGKLPADLSLSTAGKISGTPKQEGTFEFTVAARSGECSGSQIYVLTILPPLPLADLALAKTSEERMCYEPDAPRSYSFRLTNNGPNHASGFNLALAVSALLEQPNVACVATGAASCGTKASSGNTVTFSGAALSAGEINLSISGVVKASATGALVNTASLVIPPDANFTDPNANNNAASSRETLCADLAVSEIKCAPVAVLGQKTTYDISFNNLGPSQAQGATLSHTPPPELTNATWSCQGAGGAVCPQASGSGAFNELANLPPRGSLIYSVTATVATTGTLVLRAAVAVPAETTDPDSRNNTAEARCPITPLTITKDDQTLSYTPGRALTYTVTVANVGSAEVIGAVVTDEKPPQIASWAWACTRQTGGVRDCQGAANSGNDFSNTISLPAGGTLTYTVTAQAPSNATGNLNNTACIALAAGAKNCATDTDTPSPQARLSISKDDGQPTYTPRRALSYTVRVANDGPSDVSGAVLTDKKPPQVSTWDWVCTAATGSARGCAQVRDSAADFSNQVDLPAGSSLTYTVTARVPSNATGALVNTACIAHAADTQAQPNCATDTDTPRPLADLHITKTNNVTRVTAGEPTTYTIVVRNLGPHRVSGATLTDTFPTQISSIIEATCTSAGGAICPPLASNLAFNVKVDLPVAGSLTFTVKALVAPAARGTLANTATVTAPEDVSDPDSSNDSATDGPDVIEVKTELSLSQTNGADTVRAPGETTYALVVRNAGPSDAVGARVSDPLPGGVTSFEWRCLATGGATCQSTGTGALDQTVNLPARSSLTYTIKATVACNAPSTITNTATVTAPAEALDPIAENNSARDEDQVVKAVNLALSNTNDAAAVTPGSQTVYRIRVSNTGPCDALGATVVTDLTPAEAIRSVTWACTGADGAQCNTPVRASTPVNIPVAGAVVITATVDVQPNATGRLSSTATVTPPAATTDSDPANNSATDNDPLVPKADLELISPVTRLNYELGAPTNLSYVVEVANHGPSDLSGATLTLNAPPTVTLSVRSCATTGGNGAVTNGCTPGGTGNSGNATLTLQRGAKATLTFNLNVSAKALGVLLLAAQLSPGVMAATDSANSATLALVPRITFARTEPGRAPGEHLVARIFIRQSGSDTLKLLALKRRAAGQADDLRLGNNRKPFFVRKHGATADESFNVPLTLALGERLELVFDPLIPARRNSDPAAALMPEEIASELSFELNGQIYTSPLQARLTTAVMLVHPCDPALAPVVTLERAGDIFTVNTTIFDPNLDLQRISFRFFAQNNQQVGGNIPVELPPALFQSLTKGESFVLQQRFSGAADHPEVVKVSVIVLDGETSVGADSGAVGCALNTLSLRAAARDSLLVLPAIKLVAPPR